MQDRKQAIARQLAENEIGLREPEALEQLEQFIRKSIATIQNANPGIQICPELELGVILSLEKQLENKSIRRISQLENPSVIGKIDDYIMTSPTKYQPQEFVEDRNTQNDGDNIAIASMTFAEFISKDMSPEEVLKLNEEYKKSDEYKQSITNAYEQLYNGETSEISEKAGNVIRMNKVMNNTQKYCVQKRGGKADIATLILIARAAVSNDIALQTSSLMLAKASGFENVINQDGTINIEEVQKSMQTVVQGDSQLEERFSTVEKLVAVAQEANQRAAKRAAREASLEKDDFGEKMKTASTVDEKQALVEGKIKTDRVKKLLKVMISVGQSKSQAPISKYMEELYDLDSNLAKQVLPEVGKRIDNTFRKDQITSFLENKTNLGKDVQATPKATPPNNDEWNR